MLGSGPDGHLTFGEDLLARAYRAMTDAASVDPQRAPALLRMFGGTLERMARRKKTCAERGIAVPEVLFMSVTGDCNLRCPHCFAGGYAREHMPLPLAERIVTEACELGVCVFVITGGEPLLYPDFLAMAREMSDVLFLIFTNGILLPAFLAAGGAGPNMLWAVSVDGPRPCNDARRGEGTFDQACEAMEALRAEGLAFGFSTTISDGNLVAATSPDYIESMAQQGCRMGLLLQEMPNGSCDFVLEGLEEQVEFCRAHSPIPLASLPGDEARYGGCLGAGRALLHIAPDGSVETCPITHFSVASLRSMSLGDALHSLSLRGRHGVGGGHPLQVEPAERLVSAPGARRTA